MTAAAYGSDASTSSRANRSTPASVGGKPAGQRRRIRIDADAQDRAGRGRPGGEPLEVRRGHERGGRRGGGRSARGRVGAGSWSSGRTSPGARRRRGRRCSSGPIGSLAVHAGAESLELDHPQVHDLARHVEVGDLVAGRATTSGAQLSPSSVSRSSSAPLAASRITTSVPNALVLVAARYRPSGDHDGCR